MFTKKEIIITIIGITLGTILIYFLPQIEEKFSNRKIYEYDQETAPKQVVDKYICTFGSNSNLLKLNIEATFYINNNKVSRIYTRKTETYTKESDYKEASQAIEKNIDTENHTLKTSLDNINWTIIVTEGINITDGVKTNYPNDYEELKTYLETNKYTCTIRYKTK